MSNLQFDDNLEYLRPFLAALANRLAKGEREYQGRSLSKSPAELLTELQLEALDLAGWGAILFMRIEALRGRAHTLGTMPEGGHCGAL